AGLDPKGRDKILNMIKEYRQQYNKTVILVSHSMEDVAKYATKVLVMNQSKLYAYGTVDEVFSKAEEIEKIGLAIPQVTKVFVELNKRGYNVSKNVYTIAKAKSELMKLGGKLC
ncbi:MAG: energy-coupling factor transporter ATPase, partial [Oscillospiraceae bacterium]